MKSKHQRQVEAIERKKKNVPDVVRRLQAAVRRSKDDPHNSFQQREVASLRAALARVLREIGHARIEADGMANSVANGGSPDAWLSHATNSSPAALPAPSQDREPNTIAHAMTRLQRVVPGATAALLIPHPFRTAIQVRADAPDCDGSFIVDMSILEIDRLASAMREQGLRVFRNEASYLEHQLAAPAS